MKWDQNILASILEDCRHYLSFSELLDKYSLRSYELLSYLYYYSLHPVKKINIDYLNQEIHQNIIVYQIKELLLGIVSDTHDGSDLYQFQNIQSAYQNMYQMGVRTVLHCGDFLHGFFCYANNDDYLRQLDHFLETFPEYPGMVHLFLIGNHDFTFLNRDIDLAYFMGLKRPDMMIIGLERAYIQFWKMVIQSTHPVQQEHIAIPIHKANLIISGHFHRFYYHRFLQKFDLDPLCKPTGLESANGYSILEHRGIDYIWTRYSVEGNVRRKILLNDSMYLKK